MTEAVWYDYCMTTVLFFEALFESLLAATNYREGHAAS